MSAVVVLFPKADAGTADEPLCADYDPEWWFEPEFFDRAIEVCGRCPARSRCLNQALESGEIVGVWGGHTPAQRAALPDAQVVPIHRPPSGRGRRER